MRAEKDFVEFLGLFNKHKVRYCIIGAFAVGFWGYPRYTKDIDILVEPTAQNAKKIIKAMREFGMGNLDLSEKDFTKKDNIIQLGYEPVRIDILTSIKNFKFKDIWKNKKIDNYGNQRVFFIGRKDLLKSKKIANRPSDKIDVTKLLRRS